MVTSFELNTKLIVVIRKGRTKEKLTKYFRELHEIDLYSNWANQKETNIKFVIRKKMCCDIRLEAKFHLFRLRQLPPEKINISLGLFYSSLVGGIFNLQLWSSPKFVTSNVSVILENSFNNKQRDKERQNRVIHDSDVETFPNFFKVFTLRIIVFY